VCLVQEDVRTARFAGFATQEDLLPSQEQLSVAEDLVAAFNLQNGTPSYAPLHSDDSC
jgi:hypothetical protein